MPVQTFRDLSIASQLGWGIGALVISVIAVLSLIISISVKALMFEELVSAQEKEVAALSILLESNYENLLESTNIQARTLGAFYNGQFSNDESKRTEVYGVSAPTMYFEGEPVNMVFDTIDRFTAITEGPATIFARDGDDFIRVTTSLKKENGARAVGTYLGKAHPGYEKLMSGEAYIGTAHLFGVDYLTRYDPIFDAKGDIVGILFVGQSYNVLLKGILATVENLRFGETGYAFLVDTSRKQMGQLVYHPRYTDERLQEVLEENNTAEVSHILKQDAGRVTLNSERFATTEDTQINIVYHKIPRWNWTLAVQMDVSEINAGVDRLLTKIMMLAVLIACCAIYIDSRMLKRRLRPLQLLNQKLKLLGEGKLAIEFDASHNYGKNEVDLIEASLASTVKNLRQFVTELHNSNQSLNESAVIVNDNSVTTHEAAENTKIEAEHVATAVNEMSASVQHVSESAKDTTTQAENASRIAMDGEKEIHTVNDAIIVLANELKSTSDTINQLKSDTSDIVNVVDVINEVAEQTNLLALNAAIEAARAGEQGRGFAVVADEVRVLAQRTKRSTQEIRAVVERLVSRSEKAVQQMDSSLVSVEQNVSRVSHAGEAFSLTVKALEAVVRQMTEVASATVQQHLAVEQINQSAVKMQMASEQAFDTAELNSKEGTKLNEQATALSQRMELFSID